MSHLFFERFVRYVLNKEKKFSSLHTEEREKWGWELAHHWQVGAFQLLEYQI